MQFISLHQDDAYQLKQQIFNWALDLGFADLKVTNIDPALHYERLEAWLAKNYHGSMRYMQEHAEMRLDPKKLLVTACRVISVRMDYLPETSDQENILQDGSKAYISRYALGRDYHKLMRKRLKKLCQKIRVELPSFDFRICVDSAPILEKGFAEKAGLGWIGKNTLLLHRQAGSYFFLGEILTNLSLPIDEPLNVNYCGSCRACITACPTNAIVAPYQLDARRCISYLTIENKGPIPLEFRTLIGNRVFGCDDCQIYCPWNRYATLTQEIDFQPRHHLDSITLVELFNWSEQEFLEKTEGSPLRRASYLGFMRNVIIGLGNAPFDALIITALRKKSFAEEWLQEHINWAIEQQLLKSLS